MNKEGLLGLGIINEREKEGVRGKSILRWKKIMDEFLGWIGILKVWKIYCG